MSSATVDQGTFRPQPGAASLRRRLLAQAGLEVRMVLRNGEQLLITIVVPAVILAVFGTVEVMDVEDGQSRVDVLMPAVLALAVISTALPGLAIGTGFERRHGALRRLGATPLQPTGLLVAKAISVVTIVLLQLGILAGLAQALGWSPHGSWAATALLLATGTAAFSALALLMAGTLRAEATLAAANLLYLLTLVTGGVAIPLDRFPEGARPVLEGLPAGALSEGLQMVLREADTPWWAIGVLSGWALLAGALAARTFRWE